MKFNISKFPILKTIKSGGLPKYNMGKPLISDDEVVRVSQRINNIISNSKTYYFSENIQNYIKNDTFNLSSKMEELLMTDISGVGVFLFNNDTTIVYSLECKNGKIAFEIHQLVNEDILASTHVGFIEGLELDYQSVIANIDRLNTDSIDSRMVISSLITHVIFKQYAPIETLIVNKDKTRKGVLNKLKHLNECSYDITVIDSNWFTNIIRTKGFGVTGHFALRACGIGHVSRKLVWIDSYQKSGYSRLAKKLSDN
jgi:hypothetical protein